MTLNEVKDIINMQKAGPWTTEEAKDAYVFVLGLLDMVDQVEQTATKELPKVYRPADPAQYSGKGAARRRATYAVDVNKIRSLFDEGKTAKEIAGELGYGYSTVAAHVKSFREQGNGLSEAEEAEVSELAKSLAEVDG